MFTQAFLCYINRHAGEGESEETDRGGEEMGKRNSIIRPFIHSPRPSV